MKKWRLCCVPVAPFPIYNSGAFSGGAASLVCPRGLQFCLPAAQKGVAFLFQLKGVGGCPIPTYCLFYEFEKGRLPCPWFHPRVLGNRKADSTPTLSANLPHFWETTNLPRLSDWSSNLISVVVCNTAAGLFLRPTITVFSQGSKPSWQWVTVLLQDPCSPGELQLELGCKDQYRYWQIIGAGSIDLQQDVANESLLNPDEFSPALLRLYILVVKA